MSAKSLVITLYFLLCTGCVCADNSQNFQVSAIIDACLDEISEEVIPCEGVGYLPYYTVSPNTPLEAIENDVNGYVVMEFTVDEQGIPKEIIVVESEPEGVFDKAAIDALSQFRYNPPIVNNQPHAVRGVLYKVEFNQRADQK